MSIRRKIVGAVVAALLAVPLFGVPTAAADASAQGCRPVDVTSPTGGAHVEGSPCWTAIGGGWFSMGWAGRVDDIGRDDSGAAAQIKFTATDGTVVFVTYRVDGVGNSRYSEGGASPGKLLYARACLINGDTVHDCSAWK